MRDKLNIKIKNGYPEGVLLLQMCIKIYEKYRGSNNLLKDDEITNQGWTVSHCCYHNLQKQ
jgi:hypothetical protein